MKLEMKKIILSSVLLSLPFIAWGSTPSIPHKFYGEVSFENGSAPDGVMIKAKVNGEVMGTSETQDGKYGYNPDLMFVTDPDGLNEGETVKFYAGGIEADQTETFENGASTSLNLTFPGSFGVIEAGDDEIIENEQTMVTPNNPTTVQMGNDLTVTISSDDSQSATITRMEKLQSDFYSGNAVISSGDNALGGYEIDIEGEGITIEITIKYSDDGIDEDTIKPYYHNGTSWVEISDFTINKSANTITFTIESANTPYAVFGSDEATDPEPTTSPGGGGPSASPDDEATDDVQGDVDGDNVVGVLDFNLLMVNWGSNPQNSAADLDGDGQVGILDFNLLMINWST